MRQLEVTLLSSVEELRAHAASWDDLWRQSSVYLPTACAEPLAIWLETFNGLESLRALVVFDGARMVGALPLVERRVGRVVRCGALPFNEWGQSGDLAIDPEADAAVVVQTLTDAVRQLGWPFLWLEGINLSARPWQLFGQSLAEAGVPTCAQEMWPEGIVDIARDWPAYEASRSRNHRRQMRRTVERLEAAGGGELVIHRPTVAGEIEGLLRRGFEVEDRSWKSRQGTSVLRRPEIFEYFCRQARALAAAGHLDIVFLEHAGRAIAFEYAWSAKGIYVPIKIGFDEEFAHLSPGQLLRTLLLENFHADQERRAIDFGGPLVGATAKWATRAFSLGRLAAALGGPVTRALVRGYALGRPRYRQLRDRLRRREDPRALVRPLTRSQGARGRETPAAPEPVGTA